MLSSFRDSSAQVEADWRPLLRLPPDFVRVSARRRRADRGPLRPLQRNRRLCQRAITRKLIFVSGWHGPFDVEVDRIATLSPQKRSNRPLAARSLEDGIGPKATAPPQETRTRTGSN
jgi:hypothetical protein